MKLRWKEILVVLLNVMLLVMPIKVLAEEEVKETAEFINNVDMGIVAMTLNKTKDNTNQGIVVPYQTIEEKYSITNLVEPAWIRCKVNYSFDGKQDNYPKQLLKVASEKWIEKNGYWYYTNPIDKNTTIDFLDGEIMSGEWTNQDSHKQFQIHVLADAVQAEHFTPNFERDEPWFGTVIEYSTYDSGEIWNGTNMNFEVRYLGGAQGMFQKGTDLFSNFGTIMPGDVLSDQIVVGNEYTTPVNIYFRVDQTDDERIADHTLLKIWAGETLIYDGTMAGAKYEQRLALFQPGEGAVLRFEIRIPERLTNTYSLNHADQKWIFRAEPLVENVSFRRRYAINTGTGKRVVFYIVGLGMSVVCLTFFVLKEKKGRQNAETEERN